MNTFFTYISKIWNNLPSSTQSMSLFDFKTQLKNDLKPDKCKHFAIGPKDSNQSLARFRTGRINLNLNKFTIGQTDDPSCLCHAKHETSEHFILDCSLYTVKY